MNTIPAAQQQQPATPNGTPQAQPTHKPAKLVKLGATPRQIPLISLAVFGDGGVGKSRLGCTMPGGVGFIPLNSKCRPTVERLWTESYSHKEFYFPAEDLLRHGDGSRYSAMQLAMLNPDCGNRKLVLRVEHPACCAQHYYRWQMNRTKDAVYTMLENDRIRSIVFDDGTQMYEDILYAHYGRSNQISDRRTAYGPPNSEMIEIINAVKARKHLLVINQAKEEYRGDAKTGTDTVKGFKEIAYHVSMLAEMGRDPKTGGFFLTSRMCQDNASLFGDGGKKILQDDDITFMGIAGQIYGDQAMLDYMEYV